MIIDHYHFCVKIIDFDIEDKVEDIYDSKIMTY